MNIQSLLTHEPAVRGAVFFGVLFLLAALEWYLPRRQLMRTRIERWPANIGLLVIGTLIVRVVAPGVTILVSAYCADHGFGLMHWLNVPQSVAVVLCVIALDGIIYAQHRVMHHVPLLWRLHRVHHADTDFDVTTALRFHPAEIVFSLGIKLIAIGALGAPVVAVIVFEIVLSASAMFNHANLALPLPLDRLLRLLIVTPDMHRVHHSPRQHETNSNYGFFLSVWDRVFASYVAQPGEPHPQMPIGLEYFREPEDQSLARLLGQPLRRDV
ncbi:MAG: sterol desaturase family protein [Pseudomonadota bacterium]